MKKPSNRHPLPAASVSQLSTATLTVAPSPGWWGFVRFSPWRLTPTGWALGAAMLALTVAAPLTAVAQSTPAAAAEATQTLRGSITDAQSGLGLPGATVRLVTRDGEAPRGTVSGPDGTFRLAGVPLGRQTVRISMVGYRDVTVPNVIVNAGKESILTLQLQESLTELNEAVVTGQRAGDKQKPNNEMALVSARTFDVETTNRFAGARNDPARMAQNFAGVGGSNDSRNDIVVRGNSPAGLLWRLEGVAIPNPNHYGGLGATGGPVSILNNNVLDKSDFLTAAFPAQYANALSGVFDLQMRPGNNDKREYLAQVGINGFELGAEGPVRAKDLPADAGHGKSSYLVNYRYSTLGAFKAIGLNFGTGSAVPEYQDLSFKFDAPRKHGRWTVWGMGGVSRINLLGSDTDTTESDLYGDENTDARSRFRMGVGGASYTHYLGENSFAKITLTASQSYQHFTQDSLSTEDRHPVPQGKVVFQVNRQGAHALVSHKFSAKDNAVAGVIADVYSVDLERARLLPGAANGFGTLNTNGTRTLGQVYAQWQHRFTERLSATAGVTALTLSGGNDEVSVEPRAGVKWQLDEKSTISAGFGLHSQIQSWQIYNVQTTLADGRTVETNRNLGPTKATHYALAYERALTPNLRVKAEAYYQQLRKAPVEMRSSSFSMLNAGADFVLPDNDSLVNKGTGRNYGVELTVERTFTDGYYFLLTGSLFDTKYKGSDGIERNTAFNGHYVTNALAGKEWTMGPNGRNVLSFGLKVTASGGRYTTPIDVAASEAAGTEKYQEDKAYTRQVPAYYRADIRIGYKLNRARLTHEIALDVQNVTNRQNVFSERYNVYTGKYATEYQLGLFPIPLYRLTF
jgi:TonB dependent receptor/Carboxypeptidase regulatory-like domain